MNPRVMRVILIVLAGIAGFFIFTWVSVWVANFLAWAVSSVTGAVHSVFGGLPSVHWNFRDAFQFSRDPKLNELMRLGVTLAFILVIIKFLITRRGKK